MAFGPELTLLGGFMLRHDGRPLAIPKTLQRLLAFLGLRRQATRTTVSDALWPRDPGDAASGNLRTALWRLRRIGAPVIRTEGETLALDDRVRTDVDELADADPLTQEHLVCGPLELLPGWYDDWVLEERERLCQMYLNRLESLARSRLRLARYGEALDAALTAMRAEPLREGPHELLIEIHLAEDNYGQALSAYRGYQDLLERELGVVPSPRIQRLLA
ncbi:MAG: hypothetical protein JOZ47_23285 [Kutzneria sp.]|nr:hypothetical protein [Kutzneria sp.]